MGKGIKIDDEPPRKRGRPAGKNRIPLTEDQKKARNAQYERERRLEYAEAMAELAVAVGCPSDMKPEEAIKFVLNYFEQAGDKSLEDLQRINDNLLSQIQSCEQRLGVHIQSDDEETQDGLQGSAVPSTPLYAAGVDNAGGIPSGNANVEWNRPSDLALFEISQTEDEILSYMRSHSVDEFLNRYL